MNTDLMNPGVIRIRKLSALGSQSRHNMRGEECLRITRLGIREFLQTEVDLPRRVLFRRIFWKLII
jgi:hypothetical protein